MNRNNDNQLDTVLASLRRNRDFMSQVVSWESMRPRAAITGQLTVPVDPRLRAALAERAITDFYTHQVAAIEAVHRGEHLIVSTATSSGKSLCYTVPVLQGLLANSLDRALYLFPTKALTHDQLSESSEIIAQGRLPLAAHSYDGDTPSGHRRRIRQSASIVLTNPDMLHAGILPQHPGWCNFFSHLRFVVIDEIHAYRGVFGSHVSNVIRRLQRICSFYGSRPQFICCSATIANPQEHAERLVELPFTLVDEASNGAPRGGKQFILYNPPLVDEALGLRRSAVLSARDAAMAFLSQDVQTIVFARARQTVELLLSYLQDDMIATGKSPESVSGYRGGYLPLERRSIEKGLRNEQVRGVVATNALELGIDIGQLSAAVLTGYPGSIASTWQQAGRAGRRAAQSAVIMIAGNSALDQYICQHPRYLFGQSPEHALCNPDNLAIMVRHLACAAFELPFRQGEAYGGFGPVDDILATLVEAGEIHETGQKYHWLGEGIPAHQLSLRTSGNDTVVIQDVSSSEPEVIGEVDLASVHLLVYEGAIYMHLARTYLVESLDWDARLASVRPMDVDYYTRAGLDSTIRHLGPVEETLEGEVLRAFGDAVVVTKATGYRKIKRYTQETLGFGEIDLPEMVLETTGYWLVFSEALTDRLVNAGLLLRPNEYGPNWASQRQAALNRDENRCRTCGAEPRPGRGLHVHHIRPFREYGYVPGQNEAYRQANVLDNLVSLCPTCHRRAELGQQTRSALGGMAYVLGNLAPLFLMCDPADIQVGADSRNPLTNAPTVVIYEQVAAGVGFSQRLYELHHELLLAALELVTDCRCRHGCPGCVGPPADIGVDTKRITKQLLSILVETARKENPGNVSPFSNREDSVDTTNSI